MASVTLLFVILLVKVVKRFRKIASKSSGIIFMIIIIYFYSPTSIKAANILSDHL